MYNSTQSVSIRLIGPFLLNRTDLHKMNIVRIKKLLYFSLLFVKSHHSFLRVNYFL